MLLHSGKQEEMIKTIIQGVMGTGHPLGFKSMWSQTESCGPLDSSSHYNLKENSVWSMLHFPSRYSSMYFPCEYTAVWLCFYIKEK